MVMIRHIEWKEVALVLLLYVIRLLLKSVFRIGIASYPYVYFDSSSAKVPVNYQLIYEDASTHIFAKK